jgi:FlaA1/EpsC-like NDP-sugar epimerase
MIRLFRVFIPASVLALVICDILIAYGCFLVSGYLVHDGDFSIYLWYEGGFAHLSLVVASLIAILYFQDLYAPAALAVRGRSLVFQQTVLAIGALFITQAQLAYIDRELMTPRSVLLVGSVLYLIVEPLWRRVYATSISRNLGRDRLLFLGSSETIQSVIRWVSAHPELGMTCVGILDDQHPVGSDVAGARVLGRVQDLEPVLVAHPVDRIVVGVTERRARLPYGGAVERALLRCAHRRSIPHV